MNHHNGPHRRWTPILAIALSIAGAWIAISGPLLMLASQPGGPGYSIWPLPGLVLMDWAMLGVLGLLAAYLGTKPLPGSWPKAAWFAAGGLIPLMVLGALSIGPLVLLSLIFLIASATLVAVDQRLSLLHVSGYFALGILINLGLLFGSILSSGNL